MSEIFLKIMNMSIASSWLILVIVILRLVLKQAPKWVHVLLWGIAAVRLICPFSFESMLSLIPSAQTISPTIMMDKTPSVHTGVPVINRVINPVISNSFAPSPEMSANPLQIWIPILSVIWLMGIVILFSYAIASYWRLHRKINIAVRLKDNIYQTENISSPFVLGIIKPRIYLPYTLNEQDLEHVVAHELAHIRRKDHWWKPIGYIFLMIHWFNPLVWIAYVLLCRDIELACDEKVIKELGNAQKADYMQALVACSIKRHMVAACPLAFGEVGVKERVKSVMNYKKPSFWIVIVSLILCIIVAFCFLTDPIKIGDHVALTNRDGSVNSNKLTYDIQLGNEAKSGEIYIEQWIDGNCVRSAPIVMTQLVDSINISMRERRDGNINLGTEIQVETNQYGGSLLTYFPHPEDKEIVGWAFNGYELNEKVQVSSDSEVILATKVFDMGNGVRVFDCETLVLEPERLQNSDYMIVVRAVFSPDDLGVANIEEASVPKEVLTLNDVIILSQKEHDLSWEDFEKYDYAEAGSGLYIRIYEINDEFQLMIGGAGPESEPMYIYLCLKDSIDTRIDIRDGYVEEFISEYGSNDSAYRPEGTLHLGLNAEIIEIDDINYILYVKDIDSPDLVFGERCAIECWEAMKNYNLLYTNYETEEVSLIEFSDFQVGDDIIIGLYESEKENAFNDKAVAEQIQLGTQRMNDLRLLSIPCLEDTESKYYLTIGADGVKKIELTMPNSSGVVENADGSLFKKGDRIRLEDLDGYSDLRGLIITAMGENGKPIWGASIPSKKENIGFTHVGIDEWKISDY